MTTRSADFTDNDAYRRADARDWLSALFRWRAICAARKEAVGLTMASLSGLAASLAAWLCLLTRVMFERAYISFDRGFARSPYIQSAPPPAAAQAGFA